jgi:decaprenylphospho-beta-D-erythro-pentofuranosid-2-ulose 2-reductase
MGRPLARAIVVGASSGIGEAVAKRLAAEGATVAVVARRADRLAQLVAEAPGALRAYAHDVREAGTVRATFERIVADLGGLDVIVYAAGTMPRVEEGEYDFEKDREMIEVNVLGAIAWLDLAAAHFEAAHAGTLVGISSVAGERGRRGAPVYTTSKAALTAYLEALRNRLTRYGVSVVTVKPGFVDTAMTEGMKTFWLVSPDYVAERVVALAKRGGSPVAFVPRRWAAVMSVIRAVPSFVFRRTNV